MKKVLIIGRGLISRFHEQAVLESDRLALAGRVSYRSDDWRKALAEPGLGFVVVATASGAHDEIVFEAARLRVPVLVEKPLSISSARIDAMAEACTATGTPLGCICQTRWTPAFQAALAAVKGGHLGRITFARVDVPWWRDDKYYTDSEWHGTWAMDGGGALMNQSIHMIDWLTAIMPPVAEVKGFAATLAHPMEAEDTASATLRFEGGALGAVYGATSSWPGRAKTLEITGTRGTIVLKDHSIAEWNLADGTDPESLMPHGMSCSAEQKSLPHGSNRPDQLDVTLHKACFEAFADSLDGGAPYPIDAAAARRSVALIERISHPPRIGILGGSFNPIHYGHLGIARRAVEELLLDKLFIVPAKVNPFKIDDGEVAGGLSDDKRWELVCKVADLDPRFEAWDIEIKRSEGPSYAIDTVRALEDRFPGAKMYYVIGEDNVADLPKWKDWAELSAKCTFVPYPRTWESSTEIRRRLLSGEPVDALVPPCVADAFRSSEQK